MDTMISVDARRAAIETNLEVCKRSIALSMWQIGTLLNAAKDEGLVPHGEWTAWATAHSGLNERGVQLAMRQARELGEGSPLLMLDDSKINALIRIPAEEREAFAEAIDAEHASSRDVARAVADYRRRLDAARAERDEALRLVGAQKEALSKAREERETTMREAVMAAIRQEREEAEARQAQAVREAEEAAGRHADERIAQAERNARDADLRAVEAMRQRQEAEDSVRKADCRAAEANRKRQEAEASLRSHDASAANERKRLLEQLRARTQERDEARAGGLANEQRAALESRIEQLEDELDELHSRAAVATVRGGGSDSPVAVIHAAVGEMIARAGGSVADLTTVRMDEQTAMQLMGLVSTMRTMAQGIADAVEQNYGR